MKPEPAIFTKENPCTKLEIWNCFRGRRGFRMVQVDEAKAEIGVNVPRVMERANRLIVKSTGDVDYFVLTEEGKAWLIKGIKSFLKNHPSRRSEARYLPRELK